MRYSFMKGGTALLSFIFPRALIIIVALLVLPSEGLAAADPSFSCLTLAGPKQTVTGHFNTAKFEPPTATNKKFDARGARFTIPSTVSHGMIVLSNSGDAKFMCWAGGYVTSNLSWHPLNASWEQSKHGTDNTPTSRGQMENTTSGNSTEARTTWTGMHVYNVHDGIRTSDAFNNWKVQHSWFDYVRDDCVENDGGSPTGHVFDILCDGVNSFYSSRPGDATKTVKIAKALVRMEPMPRPDSSAKVIMIPGYNMPFGHGNIFKLEADLALVPKFEITNSVFLLEYDAKKTYWPPKSKVRVCKNNTFIWLGSGPVPAEITKIKTDFPSCVTILTGNTGKTFWANKVTSWHNRHPNVGKGKKPPVLGAYKWPRF